MKLSNTNLVVSRHIKREKASLPVDVRRSKTSLLKLPIIPRGQSVSGHVVQAKMIRHRNELTVRDWENAEQGLGKL